MRCGLAPRGFTLIELVVALTLSMIVAGFIAMFLATPIEAYFSQSSRSDLGESATSIVRNIDADIRQALPLSVRKGQSGAITTLEMLATVDVARYFATGEAGGSSKELQVGTLINQFATIGPFNTLTTPFSATGDYLVVNHRGVAGQDAYRMANVITPAGRTISVDATGMLPGEDRVRLSSSFAFSGGDSPSHSVFLVSGPVAYLCDTAAHTLYRYWNFPISPAIPLSPAALVGARSALIAQHVASCAFTISAGTGSDPGVVSATIQLQNVVDNRVDDLPLFLQAPLEYVP